MCGIVGYVGPRKVRPLLLAGLEKLEYRGYDSAGISVLADDRVDAVRAVGNLSALRSAIARREEALAESADDGPAVAVAERPAAQTGIGHTRWATHGRVTEENAHPHYDTTDNVHIVVNGIVENYIALKARLADEGAVFTSETDAEVIAHLVAHHYDGDLLEAVRAAYAELRGHYAFVAMTALEPGVLVAARKECPLIVGRGDGEQFIASAIPAFLRETRSVQYMDDDELVAVRADGVQFFTPAGEPVEHEIVEIDWDADTAEKQGYETFMLKEINEQADAVAETIGERAARGWGIDLGDLTPPTHRPATAIDDALLRRVRRVVIVACGTAYHAGLVGRYAIEHWARLPVEVDIASEYRYRNPVVGPDDLVIGISQSGETADTLAAMREAKRRGAKTLGLVNVVGSTIAREDDGGIYLHAGPEIGVASTKAFTSQVIALSLLTLKLARLRTLSVERGRGIAQAMEALPAQVQSILDRAAEIEKIADKFQDATNFLYLGRGYNFPVALEGALKLKEISYIHAEGYPAAEMKHGPIALIDENMPVVFIAPHDSVFEKVVSNINEVKARGGRVIVITSRDEPSLEGKIDFEIRIPETMDMLYPVLAVIPLQLLAYYMAAKRGLNVDQPRNLAKSVTVE